MGMNTLAPAELQAQAAAKALREIVDLVDLRAECLRVRQRRPQFVTRRFPQELLDAEADLKRRWPLAIAVARALAAPPNENSGTTLSVSTAP